jgi:hypothetical protein
VLSCIRQEMLLIGVSLRGKLVLLRLVRERVLELRFKLIASHCISSQFGRRKPCANPALYSLHYGFEPSTLRACIVLSKRNLVCLHLLCHHTNLNSWHLNGNSKHTPHYLFERHKASKKSIAPLDPTYSEST